MLRKIEECIPALALLTVTFYIEVIQSRVRRLEREARKREEERQRLKNKVRLLRTSKPAEEEPAASE